MLQELEQPYGYDVSVNDAFRPLSRFFDRVWRPEQLPAALLGAMRVLTDPAETGAVTIALPQDVQAEACGLAGGAVRRSGCGTSPGPVPEPAALARAVAAIRGARRPLLVAGGGVIYAEATEALRRFAEATGIPVADTQAGKGAISWDHPQSVGGVGSTGSQAANALARDADLVIGVGTRYSDFTTASQTAFQNPDVRFVNLNVAAFDAAKHAGVMLVADARAGLEALTDALSGYRVDAVLHRAGPRAWSTTGSGSSTTPTTSTTGRCPRRPRCSARSTSRSARTRRPRPGGRLHARRPADALAGRGPQAVPRRVRLLLHGLRDRRRARASRWPPPSGRCSRWSATAPT